jgi:hypothetical protein
MADAAAFFATKKKKKTPFKFNANNIDASTVEKKVHVWVALKGVMAEVSASMKATDCYVFLLLNCVRFIWNLAGTLLLYRLMK